MESVTERYLELYQRAVTESGTRDGPGAMSDPIAISRVVVGEEEERLVLAVLRSGQLAQGPMVAQARAGLRRACAAFGTRSP